MAETDRAAEAVGEGLHRDLLRAIVVGREPIAAEELHARYEDRAARWYFGSIGTPISRRRRRVVLARDPRIVAEGRDGERVYRIDHREGER